MSRVGASSRDATSAAREARRAYVKMAPAAERKALASLLAKTQPLMEDLFTSWLADNSPGRITQALKLNAAEAALMKRARSELLAERHAPKKRRGAK